MAVRAVRGATQLDADEREHLLASVEELMHAVLESNDLSTDDLISVVFTSTADLRSEFPAVAARQLGIGDVPLLCALELDIEGSMPRVVRILAHVDSPRSRAEIKHVYLRGAAALRRDLAQ